MFPRRMTESTSSHQCCEEEDQADKTQGSPHIVVNVLYGFNNNIKE